MYFRTGKLEEAEKELGIALDLNPNDADAKQTLAAIQKAHTAQTP
jgi:Flp pilus assembly protein TadD